ncbi:unnamed protein product [Mytilus edulis]|uniref:Uncharacterized protein n=1 Tax=Mytilus edulis TaxID=6550 RepID=A0A8S3QVQ8_MYTED|nr:unnamed protein product [Mytilus edulis]
MTFSVSGKQKHDIQLENRQRMMDVVDKNTVAVLLSNNSVAIVDIQQNNVQYIRNIAIPYGSGTSIYIENQFYVDDELGIIVFDMSETVNRRIELSFTPRNMCYDVESQLIYCYTSVNSTLVCIARDDTIAFTFHDPIWTNLHRITIHNDGNLLVLCRKGDHGKTGYVIKVDSNDKSSEVVIRNIKMSSYISCICFDRLQNSVVIGVDDTVHL